MSAGLWVRGVGCCLLMALVGSGSVVRGETVWMEDFSDDEGQGLVGPEPAETYDAGEWLLTVGASVLADGSDWCRVSNGLMEGRDLDGEIAWQSSPINISAHADVSISVSVSEVGDLESADYVETYYSLDGSPDVLVDRSSDDFGTAAHSVGMLYGTSLVVKVKMMNNAGTESLCFDDVTVSGRSHTPGTPLVMISDKALSFSSVCGALSSPQSYLLTGYDLVGGVSVEASSGFEVSRTSAAAGFSDAVLIPAADGSVGPLTLYLRMKSPQQPGAVNGVVVHSSSYASSQNLAASGEALLEAPQLAPATGVGVRTFTIDWGSVVGANSYALHVAVEGSRSGVNPIQNAGFEAGHAGGWTLSGTQWTLATDLPHDGVYALKSTAAETCHLAQDIAVSEADGVLAYEISYWYKVAAGDGSDVRIWSGWDTGPGTGDDLAENYAYNLSTSAWTKAVYTNTPAAGTENFHFEVRVYSDATVYLDDFRMTPLHVPLSGYNPKALGNTTSHSLSGLLADATYYCKVKALYGEHESEYSETVQIKTDATPKGTLLKFY